MKVARGWPIELIERVMVKLVKVSRVECNSTRNTGNNKRHFIKWNERDSSYTLPNHGHWTWFEMRAIYHSSVHKLWGHSFYSLDLHLCVTFYWHIVHIVLLWITHRTQIYPLLIIPYSACITHLASLTGNYVTLFKLTDEQSVNSQPVTSHQSILYVVIHDKCINVNAHSILSDTQIAFALLYSSRWMK